MSDPSVPDPARAPDFLDRLIARHAATAPATARVRPRLPGPFERVEAVRARGAEPETDGVTVWPSAVPTAAPLRAEPRPGTEIRHHTEHERTVVRTEHSSVESELPRPFPIEAPLLHPTAPLTAGPHPAPRAPVRGHARPGPDTGGDRAAASAPAPWGAGAAGRRRAHGRAPQRRGHDGGPYRGTTVHRAPRRAGAGTGGAGGDRPAGGDGRAAAHRGRDTAGRPHRRASGVEPQPRGIPGTGARVSTGAASDDGVRASTGAGVSRTTTGTGN
ncbi:hypothetical protein GPN2_14017 [Streptomyces murinus]